MAGIGIRLNRIFGKHTIAHTMYGAAYSMVATVAPMLVVIGALLIMYQLLEFQLVRYYDRELFACTILYIFIFALLTAAPFNSVLSKYVGDRIFEEQYDDILPCIYVGMFLNMTLAGIVGIPFCIYGVAVGRLPVYWMFTGLCGYFSLGLAFYQMLYLSILKLYKKISLYFSLSMALSVVLSLIFRFFLGFTVVYSILLAMTLGFFLIACLEYTCARTYFPNNSHHYKPVLEYFRRYWKLTLSNFLYVLGLFVHNFVFWTKTDMRMILANTFVCNQPYDMASCIAMFTNLSASVIFIAGVEMHFHERYQAYMEAILGGRLKDIENTKKRLFRLMGDQLMRVTQLQYMVSVVLFLLALLFLPRMGMSGLVMNLYPCLAAGYFVLFLTYTMILFLQYFNDLTGTLTTCGIFAAVIWLVSIPAKNLPDYWYGIGVFVGSIAAWTYAYWRLRWLEKNIDTHIYCRGNLLEQVRAPMPDATVYDLRQKRQEAQGDE